MARIQVLPLPTERAGSLEQTPFILIIDKTTEADHEMLLPFFLEPEGMRSRTGARLILVFEGEITVDGVGAAVTDAAQLAVGRALDAAGRG